MRLVSSTAAVNSAFFAKMQEDDVGLCLLIDLETTNQHYHWTTDNQEIFYTLSGTLTKYEPFPGQSINGSREGVNLSVNVIDFLMANTGNALGDIISEYDLDFAAVRVGKVFSDTPDLGRLKVFEGYVGDYSYNRNTITGQVRNRWNSANVQWPYYNYQDKCAWVFGGTGCGYDTSSITLTFSAGNIDTNSTTQLQISLVASTLAQSYSDQRFEFGRLVITTGPNSGQQRSIREHTGDTLKLSHFLPVNSFATMDFYIFPGCKKRRIEDCRSLYNNDENFLGFPWIPVDEDIKRDLPK